VELHQILLWVCGFAVAAYVRAVQAELSAVKHDQKNLQAVVTTLREIIPQRYATNEALRETMREVRETLLRIEDKLDQKADK
jgi:hypothetical protein